MTIILLLVGSVLIMLSLLEKKSERDRNEMELMMTPQSIESFQSNFYKQFEISQQKLESLYAFDFDEICHKLDETLHIVRKIEQQSETEKASIKPITTPTSVQTMQVSQEIQDKLKRYQQLKQDGKSLDEIVKILKMEKGELLFLENLSKRATLTVTS